MGDRALVAEAAVSVQFASRFGSSRVTPRGGAASDARGVGSRRWTVGPRTLAVEDGRLRTIELAGVPVQSEELALVLDAARFRHDVVGWRFSRERAEGFAGDDFDDSRWQLVPHLHPIYHLRYEGSGFFRHHFSLPTNERGSEATIVLGGLDDEDWQSYRVFLNGEELDAWEGSSRWREPRRVRVPADALREENLLAVETRGLDRRRPEHRAGEDEHYFFIGWLLDQFVCTGEPYRVVRDFEVEEIRGDELDLRAGAFDATIAYSDEGGLHRKTVRVRNAGSERVRLLDVILDDLLGPFDAPSRGGRGQPVLIGDLFYGIEHPAGVNQGHRNRIRALAMPGRVLGPGEEYAAAPVVMGRGFPEYLLGRRPRRERRITVYSALGWYDYTNPADALFELTSELLEENVAVLERLREQGVEFDVYMVDDWWEPTDFDSFRRSTLPSGGPAIAARLREAGLRHGLWCATTRAVWTSHEEPGMEACVAGGVAHSVAPADFAGESGEWNWDEEFANLFVGEKRLCLAAEPFRTRLRESLAKHARELELGVLKLDCAVPHCTSSAHDHIAGRHSVEPIVDSILAAAAGACRESPDLFVIWYWGWQSPWFLDHGDLQFDKGLKLEAASPASSPAPTFRQGVTLNVDQAASWAKLVPPWLQDSLGVWLGDVAWANRMGLEEWRDAFLIDLARGSTLVQLWGDVARLCDEDVRFLAEALRLGRRPDISFVDTVRVGGDPWLSEPYGYVQPTAHGALATIVNPGFERRALPPVPVDANVVPRELYPYPGAEEAPLAPWEVRVVEYVPEDDPDTRPPAERPEARESISLDISPAAGNLLLPELFRHDVIAIAARLRRNGAWWYHPEPQSLVRLSAWLCGAPASFETVPRTRSRNGPGCPWVVFKLPAGAWWSGRELRVELQSSLPNDVELLLEGWVYKAWWNQAARSFAPLN
jgi:hypothetical protein